MSPTVLHLRSEVKSLEHRSCLTPSTTKALIESGYEVHVEKSPSDPKRSRIYKDEEFQAVGAKLVEDQSWTSAPLDHIVIGLKEVDPDTIPLEKHTHIQFAHCYKGQAGWDKVLSRFPRGGGILLDLEFLEDDNGRRVAAFGFHAGFAGSALAIKAWANQLSSDKPLAGVDSYTDGKGYYNNEDEMLVQLRQELKEGSAKLGRSPKVFVMGALGRCGRGAVDLFRKAGLPEQNIVGWDLAETSVKSGPYEEIVQCDIFVNCIYLSKPIPPFINQELLESPQCNLTVVCDVSCDTTNPHNPIPIYTVNTTFTDPTVPVELKSGKPLSVISIDHLPSLLPRESSEAFSNDLLPYLKQLDHWKEAPVWSKAEKLFNEKVATLPKESLS